ncbi:MAG: putative maturation protein [Loecwouvirus pseudonemorishabitans]|uniref:Maturation protein n=1 Tax=Leviviridae sp. TaxID=2027243 RepID=A0ABY3ST30_9VIRU|nr:MAG: putative maturation protein [Leviviridae sp.]
MTGRVRTHVVNGDTSGYIRYFNPSTGESKVFTGAHTTINESCTDTHGDWDTNNPLDLTRHKREIRYVSGSVNIGGQIYDGQNFGPLALTGGSAPALSAFSPPSVAAAATSLAAATNPSRPVVDIPAFLGEAGQLPRLVMLAGSSLLGKLASGNLAYQFGWRPLIADVNKLLSFQNHVRNRVNELERLRDKGGQKSRRELYSARTTGSGTQLLQSVPVGYVISGAYTDEAEMRMWGSIKWTPDADLPSTDEALRRLAIRSVLGLSLEPAALWEILPWSWLIDWFVNVGSFLNAHRNTVPASHGGICIMQYNYAKRIYQKTSGGPSWWTNGYAGTLTRERKRRFVQSTSAISASLPFLTARRMSILASLSVLQSEAWGRRR